MMFALTLKAIIITALVAIPFGFGSGWYTKGKFVLAAQTQALQEQKNEYEAKLKIKESVIADYAKKTRKTRIIYRTIREKVAVANVGTVCLSPDGVRLWNEAALAATSSTDADHDDVTVPTSSPAPEG